MGLFDRVLGSGFSRDTTFDAREAFAGILLATIAGDGHISDEEKEAFIAVSNRMQLFKTQSIPEFNAMVDKLFGVSNRKGNDTLLRLAAEALPAELQETAFTVATDMVFADGEVDDEEIRLLEVLQEALGIEEMLAQRVIEVLAIKNRG